MKILHIINSMGNGGAESVLYRLVVNDKNNKHAIISLLNDNFYKEKLLKKNIKHYFIGNKFNIFWFIKLLKLPILIIYNKPDLVQTWMYHSNLIGGFFAYLTLTKKIYWNIRHSNFGKRIDIKYKILLFLSAKLSKLIPNKIIFCSETSMQYHNNMGFHNSKSLLICNGFQDISKKIDIKYKKHFVKKYKIDSQSIILGNVGRWNKQKDHNNLFSALSLMIKNNKDIDFKLVLIGNNISYNNIELLKLINLYKLNKKIIIMNPTDNIQNIYSIIDISISSSSFGEGFSNFISESMICEVPCVATNVGDTKIIVNRFGWIVPPNQPKKLYNSIYEAIESKKENKQWKDKQIRAKKHVLSNFSLEKMLNNYQNAWNE